MKNTISDNEKINKMTEIRLFCQMSKQYVYNVRLTLRLVTQHRARSQNEKKPLGNKQIQQNQRISAIIY
jgi:hypothetical protein